MALAMAPENGQQWRLKTAPKNGQRTDPKPAPLTGIDPVSVEAGLLFNFIIILFYFSNFSQTN